MDEEREEIDWFEERLERERHIEGRREFNTLLKFWCACPKAACRRHRRCGGDVDICHATFWPVVPRQIKVWWRGLGDAAHDGLSLRKANAVAADAVARWRRAQNLKGDAR